MRCRKFWAALIGFTVIVISAFLPGFELDQERGASLAVIVVSYVIGVAVDPGPGGWKGVIQSRKFWAALVGLTFVCLQAWHPDFPVGEEELTNVIYLLAAYILGVAIEPRLNA